MSDSRTNDRAAHVRLELARYLGRGGVIAAVMSTLVAVVVAVVVRNAAPQFIIIVWLAGFCILNLIRVIVLRRIGASDLAGETKAGSLTTWTTLLVGVAGLFWGFAGVYFFSEQDPTTQVFLAFAIGGLAAGSLATYSAWLPAVYAFIVPSLVPLTIRFVAVWTETSAAMGLLLAFYTLTLVLLAHAINRTLARSEHLQIDKQLLEMDLATSENRFYQSFDAAGIGMTITDLDGRFLNVNPMFCNMLGYERQEMLRLTIVDVTDPEDLPATTTDRQRLAKSQGDVQTVEKRYRRKDGSLMWGSLTRSIVRNQSEEPLYIVGQIQDIGRWKEIERLKSEFVATVSHELRTPLTSIQGALSLVTAGALGETSPQLGEALDIAKRNSDRLVDLVNDILDFEKMQSGQMEFHYRNLDMLSLMTETVELNTPYAERFKVRFELKISASSAVVRGDSNRLVQVVTNLLSNAAKFSHDGDLVEIDVYAGADGCRIAIADRGPGIAVDLADKIFEPFYQVDGTDQRGVYGTGLGLSICRQIVDAHDGQISFAPRDGGGSVFLLELPTVR